MLPFREAIKKKIRMKNPLSAMGLFALTVVFGGSPIAQKGVAFDVDGSGRLKPTVGQKMQARIHKPRRDNGEIGVRSGTVACY